MKISIVYDNEAQPGFISDWGFSCLVEYGSTLLFDTGAKSAILMKNMRNVGIDPFKVDEVFISHDHYDHTGGLSQLAEGNNSLQVYVPHDLRYFDKSRQAVFTEPSAIHDQFYSTGVLRGIEHSLVLDTGKGLVLVVGCSHPGLGRIIDRTLEIGETIGERKIHAIIGGFHGFSEYQVLEDVDWICPTHCTQHIEEIRSLYPSKYLSGGAGKVMEF